MEEREVDADELRRRLRVVSRGPGVVANYHFDALTSSHFPLFCTDASLVFLDRERPHWRLFYATRDPGDLGRLLGSIAERPLLVDVLWRERPAYGQDLSAVFEAAGFARRGRFVRMRTNTLSARATARNVSPAAPELADAISDLLHQAFDERVERVPSASHVRDLCAAGQVFAAGNADRVDAVCVYELEGSLCNWRFWASRPGSHPALAVRVLGDMLADLARRGVSRGQLWVEADKAGPTLTYERLGFERDGVRAETLALAQGAPAQAPSNQLPVPDTE